LAYYPETAHGTQFDAEAVCMVSSHAAGVLSVVCDFNLALMKVDKFIIKYIMNVRVS